jgi:dihydroorotase
MSKSYLLKNGTIVNEGKQFVADFLIKDGRITNALIQLSTDFYCNRRNQFRRKIMLPGCIDDQVHFREPGLTFIKLILN